MTLASNGTATGKHNGPSSKTIFSHSFRSGLPWSLFSVRLMTKHLGRLWKLVRDDAWWLFVDEQMSNQKRTMRRTAVITNEKQMRVLRSEIHFSSFCHLFVGVSLLFIKSQRKNITLSSALVVECVAADDKTGIYITLSCLCFSVGPVLWLGMHEECLLHHAKKY